MGDEVCEAKVEPTMCPYCGSLALPPKFWRPPYEKFWERNEVHPDDVEEFDRTGPACTGCYDPQRLS